MDISYTGYYNETKMKRIKSLASGGPITVSEYMRMCLSSPAGYYSQEKPLLGARGDFITAPEVSQIFGELIGAWVLNELTNTGHTGEWQLVELGPGSGALMGDVLMALKRLKQLGDTLRKNYARIESKNAELNAAKMELERAVTDKTENWRLEKQNRDYIDSLGYDISATEQELRKITHDHERLAKCKEVLDYMRENNAGGKFNEVLDGYHGCVIELFNCESTYNKAIEVTAEGRLFYHVVDDDKVAMKLLKMINERELRDEFNFFPLNRMTAKDRRGASDRNARPMLDLMEYDEKYDVVFRSIFANTVLVTDMAVGQRVARAERFDCVMKEGDVVSRRGPMTGGYMDVKKSKISLHRSIRSQKEEQEERRRAIEQKTEMAAQLDSTIDKLRLQIDQLNSELSGIGQEYRLIMEKQRSFTDQLSRLVANKEPKKAQLLQIRERTRELEAHRQMLNSQLSTSLEGALSAEERANLQRLEQRIREKSAELDQVARARQRAENEKVTLETQLQSSLLKRREDLSAKLNDITMGEKRNALASQTMELTSMNKRLNSFLHRLSELDDALAEYDVEREKLGAQLERHQEIKRELDAQLEEFTKHTDET